MADIAREQDVTLTAIQNRRNKIFRRLKKLIDEEG
jgi:predicted dehydrogenase